MPTAFDLTPAELYDRYTKHLCKCPRVGLTLDISRVPFNPRFFSQHEPMVARAFEAMRELEGGAIANPDEQRMVGHYWLRRPDLAPTPEMADGIRRVVEDVKALARRVHHKELTPPGAARFTDVLVVGIGGSALGPQLVAEALGGKRDKMAVHFMDNTDPDGIARTLESIGTRLKSTLVVVISKSGGTPETRNGMVETQAAFAAAGLDFAGQAVAVTGEGSKLDRVAEREGWIARLPMTDWVGGRTSVMSAVGLLPAALQGVDIDALLKGAAAMDEHTTPPPPDAAAEGGKAAASAKRNPAMLLALMWYFETGGKGAKDMVVLPYKDRLALFAKYLQQLIMESLGKRLDLDGQEVHQGISVFGNKGSTDQHAYVQQLRDGLNNFFATFVVVLTDDAAPTRGTRTDWVEVEPGVTSGDYLNGFRQGTRKALWEAGRSSLTITLDKLDAAALGAMIALYERAVGYYATFVNINAYHQPGVEAGKQAAAAVLALQHRVLAWLSSNTGPGRPAVGPEEVARGIGEAEEVETVAHLLAHLAANREGLRQVRGKYEATGG